MRKLHEPARLEGESFEKYKIRRQESHETLKAEMKPKVFWNSSKQGTYRNPDKSKK